MLIDSQADRRMCETIRSRSSSRPWARLLNVLIALAGRKAELISHAERTWASATFTGSRHTVILAFAGPEAVAAGELFMEALPEHEFTIPDQIVADATVSEASHTVVPDQRLVITVDLLLVEDS